MSRLKRLKWNSNMPIIIILLALLLLPNTSIAAPTISGTSGTLTHGSSVSVTGTGFGTKSPVAPVKWDSVDESYATRTEGATVPVGASYPWDNPGGSGMETPAFTNTNPRGKWTSKYTNAYSSSEVKNAVIGEREFTECTSGIFYVSFWHYPHTDPENPGASNKLFRMSDNGGWTEGSFATIMMDPGTGGLSMYSVATDYVGGEYIDEGVPGQWNRFELTVDNSSTPRPSLTAVVNNVLETAFTASSSITAIDGIYTLGADWSNSQNTPIPILDWGEIYVDNTKARVEICNANTKDGSNHCEIQIPQNTWGTTSLEVKLNQGSFADSSPAYLYVVDSTGTANISGYPITFGESGSSDVTAPSTTISTGDPSAISADSLTVVGSASDAVGVSGCKWRLGSAPDSGNGTSCTGTTSFSCSTSGYSSGSNTLHVACYDSAGNYGDDSIVVNYTPSEPEPSGDYSVLSGGTLTGGVLR